MCTDIVHIAAAPSGMLYDCPVIEQCVSKAVRFRAVICYMGSPTSDTSGMLAVYQLQGCDLVTSC